MDKIRCQYCGSWFTPQAEVRKVGKKRRTYVECPTCGNGIEREFRPYDRRRKNAS